MQSIRKTFFLIFYFFIFFQCKEGGLLPAKKTKIYGVWEMVSYELNTEEIITTKKFINYGMSMSKGNYSEPTVYAHRRITSQVIPVSYRPNEASFNESFNNQKLYFDRLSYKDTLGYIDPWFYRSSNSMNADTLGGWNVIKLNNRILIIENTSFPKVDHIKITYEKTKEIN